ncbi:unnamed protein product [Ectocarpus sp. 12 AP-2014]
MNEAINCSNNRSFAIQEQQPSPPSGTLPLVHTAPVSTNANRPRRNPSALVSYRHATHRNASFSQQPSIRQYSNEYGRRINSLSRQAPVHVAQHHVNRVRRRRRLSLGHAPPAEGRPELERPSSQRQQLLDGPPAGPGGDGGARLQEAGAGLLARPLGPLAVGLGLLARRSRRGRLDHLLRR